MKTLLIIILPLLLLLSFAQADTILSPNIHSPPGPNGVSSYPLLLDAAIPGPGGSPAETCRYQQVYSASDFAPLFQSGGGMITGIKFIYANTTLPPSGAYDIQIVLSSTQKAPDGLSTSFADNFGPDQTLVFARRTFSFQNATTFLFPLDHPFFYSGAPGQNLLMDFRNFGGAFIVATGTPSVEAQYTSGDSVSSLLATDVNALSGGTATWGVLTEFAYTPVPEPSVTTILAAGGGLLVLRFVVNKARAQKAAKGKGEVCR